jgi:hypothetical protein
MTIKDIVKKYREVYHTIFWSLLSVLLTTFCLLPAVLSAQAPDTLWTKTYGDWHEDGGFSIDQTTDGGYIVTGSIFVIQKNDYDLWLLKTDSLGDTLWTKTYGGDEWDYGVSIQQTPDHGYIIAGQTESYGPGYTNIWLLKADSLGDTLWTKTYGGTGNQYTYSVKKTMDSGYIISGCTNSYGAGGLDAWLIKTDSLGDTLWTKVYGGYYHDVASSVIQTPDMGYAFTGLTQLMDLYIVKTDSLGSMQWAKCYAGINVEWGYDIQETPGSGYIIIGITSSLGAGAGDIWLLKTDSLGDTLWTKTYGGEDEDFGYAIDRTSDGGYILAGYTESIGAGARDVYVIKTDSLGGERWSLTCGGTADDEGRAIQQTPDQGYIIAGTTKSFGAGGRDVYLICIAPDTMEVMEKPRNAGGTIENIWVTPNPFCDWARIDLAVPTYMQKVTVYIYDALGCMVRNINLNTSDKSVASVYWDGCDADGRKLASGVYFITVDTGEKKIARQILLIR